MVERVPGWEMYPWLRAGFSTRLGGVSTVYAVDERGELNLGWTASDAPENVARNRAKLVSEVGGDSKFELVAVRQTHSVIVRRVDAEHGELMSPDGKAVLEGDGLMTSVPGVMLSVQVADCVPVIVVDVEKRVVAAFHAGWRGTVARIVEQGVAKMRLEYGSRSEDLVAAIGPSIGPCCFEVGAEVRAEFEAAFPYAAELFRESPTLHADLWAANRRQLLDAGVQAARISLLGECSACSRVKDGGRKYFSHRAEKGFTGRMMAVVGIAHDEK